MENNKNKFIEWLQANGRADSTVSKYASQAHNRIMKELGASFYDIENMDYLNRLLLEVKKFEKSLPKENNRMYSSAVSNYIKFKSKIADTEDILTDEAYETEVERVLISEPNMPDYNLGPQKRSLLVNNSEMRYQRKPEVGAAAIIMAKYRCEYNTNHIFFVSRRTHENYVEAHHLIPIAYQGIFENGIDVVENVFSLCPVCHRCIHYGENYERKIILRSLHSKSRNQLFHVGIEIKEAELMELYKISLK